MSPPEEYIFTCHLIRSRCKAYSHGLIYAQSWDQDLSEAPVARPSSGLTKGLVCSIDLKVGSLGEKIGVHGILDDAVD